MIKVLYILPALKFGGIEQYLLNLVDYIDKNRFELEVLCVGNESALIQASELTEERKIALHHFPQPTNFVKKIIKWVQLLRRNKYDIVHILGMPNTGALYLLTGKCIIRKTKWIIHAHMGYRDFPSNNKLKSLVKIGLHPFINSIYRHLADIKAGCSHKAMQLHFGKNIQGNGILLNNGINLSRFRSSRSIKALTRNLICVAHISTIKNPFFLLDLMQILVSRNPDWRLSWVGSGELEEQMRHAIHEKQLAQNISMLGVRRDIPELLNQHSIFLLASLYEAFAIVLIEAQAAGCVCISSTAPPKEAECGALIRLPLELGAEAWANKIEELYENQTEMRIDEARLSQFDIKNTAHEIEKLYDSLVL